MPDKHENKRDDFTEPTRPPGLSREELENIERQLAATDARRRSIHPRMVRVLIDGVEHTKLDLTHAKQLEIGLEAGAGLVEVRGQDDHGDILLATHLISYANEGFELSRAKAVLNSGKLEFEVTPVRTLTEGAPVALLRLNYQPKFQIIRPWALVRGTAPSRRRIAAYTLAGLAIGFIGWLVADAFYEHKIKVLEQQIQRAQSNSPQVSPTSARAILSYRLTPDEQAVRGPGAPGAPEISLHAHPWAISLELPVSRSTAGAGKFSAELKTFSDERILMTQNFLEAAVTDSGPSVQIVIPAELLRTDTYYTVVLHSAERTDHFTFKVVDGR